MRRLGRWWQHPRIPLTKTGKLRLAWVTIGASLVGWPISLLLLQEPPVILSLSWLALTYTAWDIVSTADSSDDSPDSLD